MPTTDIQLAALAGTDLGERTLSYTARDAILYALAVGAPPDRLDLVYERDLRTLPVLGAALGLWAVEAAGGLGAYDRTRSLHAGQRLEIRRPLPPEGSFPSTGRVAAVWDKGRAAVVEIEVESEHFVAGYTIFLPGLGGWGGERGPSGSAAAELEPTWETRRVTRPEAAALYRLTGDRHPIHVDPQVAAANGFERPILHGLCTLGMAALEVADAVGAHPAELRSIEARLAAPVMPGAELSFVAASGGAGEVAFAVRCGDAAAISGGRAWYAGAG